MNDQAGPVQVIDPADGNDRSARGPSLLDVVREIPEVCYTRSAWRSGYHVVRDVLIYAVLVFALINVHAWWLVVPLWLLTGLSISGIFVLGHDASHNSLFASRGLNKFIAKVAFLPSAHVESAWDFGHNRVHHGHTVKQGMDFVWHPSTRDEYRAMSRARRFQHRIEWSFVGAGLYYGRNVWWSRMMRFRAEGKLGARISRERIAMVGLLAVAAAGLGWAGWHQHASMWGVIWMFLKVAVVPWLLFTWMIGFVVYVQHINGDITWHQRREWSKFRGQMEGTTNLTVSRPLNFFIHNIFTHVPHHVDMRIPFYRLPAAMRAINVAFPGVATTTKLRWRDYLATTAKCKVFDFETGCWSRYREFARGDGL